MFLIRLFVRQASIIWHYFRMRFILHAIYMTEIFTIFKRLKRLNRLKTVANILCNLLQNHLELESRRKIAEESRRLLAEKYDKNRRAMNHTEAKHAANFKCKNHILPYQSTAFTHFQSKIALMRNVCVRN